MRYFVAYTFWRRNGTSGIGRGQLTRDTPLRDMDDVLGCESTIVEQLNAVVQPPVVAGVNDVVQVLVTFWRPFEE
jgi:hypothetical protein